MTTSDDPPAMPVIRGSARWPHLLTDYLEALLRVASLRADGEPHFLFDWVELYPFDMSTPVS